MPNNSIILNKIEYKKYAQQIILDNIGINGQKRLKNAKILTVGLGGLGCPAILYLVASGIGHIGIMDYDKVTLSNLNRQILYNIHSINQNKTYCAKVSIKNINQECQITMHNEKLDILNAHKIIKQYDILIDATDNFKTRYIIDEICYKLHKVHIYGAINKYEGHISVFNYKNNLRYTDIYPKTLNLQELNCGSNGIIGTMSGIIGILQATEAIKITLGIGNIQSGKILQYNLLQTSFNEIKISAKKKENELKTKYNNISEIHNILNIHDIKKIYNKNILIIDIRNRIDFQLYHQSQAINIPAQNFQAKKTIEFIRLYFSKYILIISCHKILTSLTISNLLNTFKIKTYILKQQS
jgi:adenylyltransferase/sulfurtransferase